jgi:hypothetical protein
MAVPITLGASPQWDAPVPLFRLPAARGSGNWPYAPRADGQRFLVRTLVESTAAPPITVLTNWLASAMGARSR